MLPPLFNHHLKQVALITFGANAIGFSASALLKTHKITDLVGVGSFVLSAAQLTLDHLQGQEISLAKALDDRIVWINTLVMIWGGRLASYLFQRILELGRDHRLEKFFPKDDEPCLDTKRSNFPIHLGVFWSIQALWGVVCMLPVTLVNSTPSAQNSITHTAGTVANTLMEQCNMPPCAKRIIGVLGMSIACLPLVGACAGIALEAIADYQKQAYRDDPANADHWCDEGLWKLSRYPNYFGEMLTWWSIYLAAVPVLWTSGPPALALGLASPAFVTFLLCRVSGIPLTEARNQLKYKGDVQYEEYVANTPLLVPWPWSKK